MDEQKENDRGGSVSRVADGDVVKRSLVSTRTRTSRLSTGKSPSSCILFSYSLTGFEHPQRARLII
jgi:hypothetical protein